MCTRLGIAKAEKGYLDMNIACIVVATEKCNYKSVFYVGELLYSPTPTAHSPGLGIEIFKNKSVF